MRVLDNVLLATAVSLTVSPMYGQGNEIVVEKVQANNISGLVYGGPKDRGNLLKDVRILQCDWKFQSCMESAVTDEGGHFVVPGSLAQLKVVYLEFLFPAYNELRLIVRVHRGAPKLAVVLPVGE